MEKQNSSKEEQTKAKADTPKAEDKDTSKSAQDTTTGKTAEPAAVTQVIEKEVFDLGNLPDNIKDLETLIVTTEREMREIDEKIETIMREIKPQPKIKEVTAKTKTKRSPGTAVIRKNLKLEINELKNAKLLKRELVERAKNKFDSLFSRTHQSKVSNMQKAKGLSLYYIKRNMSRIAYQAYNTVKTISIKDPLKLVALQRNANKQDPAIIYTSLSELIRHHSPKTADLMSGSDTVKEPILNTINDGLIDWDGESELDLTSMAKETKRRTDKKEKESQAGKSEIKQEEKPIKIKGGTTKTATQPEQTKRAKSTEKPKTEDR